MFGGGTWEKWEQKFRPMAVKSQSTDGSWPVMKAPGHGNLQNDLGDTGTVYRTTLCVLMLESYYRYLPLNQASREADGCDWRTGRMAESIQSGEAVAASSMIHTEASPRALWRKPRRLRYTVVCSPNPTTIVASVGAVSPESLRALTRTKMFTPIGSSTIEHCRSAKSPTSVGSSPLSRSCQVTR
jgi:hypothetical protein